MIGLALKILEIIITEAVFCLIIILMKIKCLQLSLRQAVIILFIFTLASFIVLQVLPPILQNINYHHFADKRIFFGIKNFFNVASNIFYCCWLLRTLYYF